MKRNRINHQLVSAIAIVTLLVSWSASVQASAPLMASPNGLSFLQLKVTGAEFIVLRNTSGSDIPNLSNYWVTSYNNTNPLAAAVSSSTQQLPVAPLLAGQTLMLSADPMQTCGAAVAGQLSVSLTDSGGYLQISQLTMTPSGLSQVAGDVVSWSSGASGVIQNLPSSTKAPQGVYYRYFDGISFSWQRADFTSNDSCQLIALVAGGSQSSSAVTPLTQAAISPPATILGEESDVDNEHSNAVMPASDIGLMSPQISELLPNPLGTGNDATDEFIELYNPNDKPFELTGFSLQTGIKTYRTYVFPSGTQLAPKSFRAFSSEETGLALSNTASQAVLLDPFGAAISMSDPYQKAKEGQAWALAKGAWYWTTQTTPNAQNAIKKPVTAKKGKKKAASKRVSAVKSAKTSKLTATSTSPSSFQDEEDKSPIHIWTLALIATVALLYGAYEYRRDIANKCYQLGSKLSARPAAWKRSSRRRSD